MAAKEIFTHFVRKFAPFVIGFDKN